MSKAFDEFCEAFDALRVGELDDCELEEFRAMCAEGGSASRAEQQERNNNQTATKQQPNSNNGKRHK